eukprot:m.112287 g.112287  ORF g.112287 m.112287 type:complete len:221 (-) comp16173_c0_seq1:325-987(-)
MAPRRCCVVDLHHQHLETVPSLGSEPRAETATHLLLQSNYLALVTPTDLSPLVQLRVLSLGANRLTALPDCTSLPHLEELYLNHNKISTIDDVELPPKLQTLDLRANAITTISSPTRNCTGLKHLSLATNGLCEVPLCLAAAFPLLTTLSLFGNKIADARQLLALAEALQNLTEVFVGGNLCFPQVGDAVLRAQLLAVRPSLAWIDGRPIMPATASQQPP